MYMVLFQRLLVRVCAGCKRRTSMQTKTGVHQSIETT